MLQSDFPFLAWTLPAKQCTNPGWVHHYVTPLLSGICLLRFLSQNIKYEETQFYVFHRTSGSHERKSLNPDLSGWQGSGSELGSQLRSPIPVLTLLDNRLTHDDVIKWKHFPRYWPFARGIHRPPVNSTHKGQWCGALMFSLISAWMYGWVNNREVGNLRRYCTHFNAIAMN